MQPPGHSWQITSQVADQTRNDSAGNTEVGSLIYFVTGDGNNDVVFVPNNRLNIEHVKETVRKQARLRDLIGRQAENI